MSDNLKPCPFCGGEAELREGSSTAPYIRCIKCGCRTGSSRSISKLIAAWNTRAERTCRNVDDYGDNIGGWRDWETDGFGFTCSECGYVLYPDEMGASPLAPELLAERVKINYCPNCGAKVVE